MGKCLVTKLKEPIDNINLPNIYTIRAFVSETDTDSPDNLYVAFKGNKVINITSRDGGDVSSEVSGNTIRLQLPSFSNNSIHWKIKNRTFIADIDNKREIEYIYTSGSSIVSFDMSDFVDCLSLKILRCKIKEEYNIEDLLNLQAKYRQEGDYIRIYVYSKNLYINGVPMIKEKNFTFDGAGGWTVEDIEEL